MIGKATSVRDLACQIRDKYGYRWRPWVKSPFAAMEQKGVSVRDLVSYSPIGPFALIVRMCPSDRRSQTVWYYRHGYDMAASYEDQGDDAPYYAALIHEMSHLTLNLTNIPGEIAGTEEECLVLEQALLDALKPTREVREAYREHGMDNTEVQIRPDRIVDYRNLPSPRRMLWWKDARESLVRKGVLTSEGVPTWKRAPFRCDVYHR